MKTITQQTVATGNNPAPKNDKTIPAIKAANPAIGDCVASTIAGKVITARVT